MKIQFNVALWLAVMLLAGCQALGISKPDTFNQRLAVGYTSVTTARQAAATLLQADKITTEDAQNVQNQADTARAGLDIARSISAADPQGADKRLQAILIGLNALNAYLTSRGAP